MLQKEIKMEKLKLCNSPIELHQETPKMKSLTISCLVSIITVFFTQFILFFLPLLLPTFSFLALLPISGFCIVIVLGLGKCCKRIAGVRASAPAFVFFSVVFIWAVYVFVIRQVISALEDFLFNTEMILLILGLCRIMKSDPGFITNDPSFHSIHVESPLTVIKARGELESQHEEDLNRVRYCKHCKNSVLGFDHHCPAFGNCIGQKNHLLFITLLAGFVISEVSYATFAFQCKAKLQTLIDNGSEQGDVTRCLIVSTILFSLIQLVWQVFFLIWHVYCACFNIKTDEWINWKKYPEFQTKTVLHTGEQQSAPQFVNPYDKGILMNLKKFLTGK